MKSNFQDFSKPGEADSKKGWSPCAAALSKLIALHPKSAGMLAVCALIVFLALFEWLLSSGYQPHTQCPYKWAGGSPAFNKGSCWCGEDSYCMCTPSLAIDVLIEVLPDEVSVGAPVPLADVSLLMVHRKDPPAGHAIMGGFVDVGESVEHACVREMKEEINWTIREQDLELFKIYSDPARDLRRHTVSAVHILTTSKKALGKDIHSGDDAKGLRFVPLKTIHEQGKAAKPNANGLVHDGKLFRAQSPAAAAPVNAMLIAFDHETIIRDFIKQRCASKKYLCD
jgi:8-oxo-dGTP diphosphatase